MASFSDLLPAPVAIRPNISAGSSAHYRPKHGVSLTYHLPAPPAHDAVAAPTLIYGNGRLLSAVHVFTAFWGSSWKQAPASDLLTQMTQFSTFSSRAN